MYGNSEAASLLRQADHYNEEARVLLTEGADYEKVSRKLCLANECRLSAGEPLDNGQVLKAMHYYLLAQADKGW